MLATDSTFAPLRRFRLMAVRLALLLTAVMAAGAYFLDADAAQGLLLGGIAGIVGFWAMAAHVEKLAKSDPRKVHSVVLAWSVFRFLLYGAVLYKAFTLDDERYAGLIGAVIGLFIIRLILILLGLTGVDLAASSLPSAESDPETKAESTE